MSRVMNGPPMHNLINCIGTILILAFLSACTPPPVNRTATAPLQAVEAVDVERYMGLWFEIARFENSFEEGCVGVTAEYSLQPNGKVKVVNTCRKGVLEGPVETAEGEARIVNPPANSKLKVSFFGPFEGDYWIIGLAPDYSWALVGEPEGRYLWLLARTPRIPPALRDELTAKLAGLGYNIQALVWVTQP
jgi:apolipoprotein D and lipocalin family protein